MFGYLIIFVLCFLSTAKMSFQSAFGKKNITTTLDAITFTGFIFLFSALVFAPKVSGCSLEVWIFALFGGVFTVLYQLSYIKALSIGNVSLTVLIVNFGMVINVLVSYIFYNEPVSALRFFGILLCVVSFLICKGDDGIHSNNKNWLLYTITAMVSTSIATIVQKILGESKYSGESEAFISCLYIISAIITFVVYVVLSKKGGQKTFKINFNMLKYAIGAGLALAVFQAFYIYAISNVDGTYLFPAYTAGTVVFSTLSGVVIFKDKLNKPQITGIILGVASIIIMNF